MQPQQRDDDTHKDVVIIGNGPSGICLSYLFSGNWPHYTGETHPMDEMLTARLRYSVATQTNDSTLNSDSPESKKTRCSDCRSDEDPTENRHCFSRFCKRDDLEFLSTGLEGRNGGKPLSLLMDNLQHPCIDAGLDVPSLLSWKSLGGHSEHKVVDHVVLGKGPPGGAWHSLDPNVLTISLNRWMSLPGLDLRDWELGLGSDERKKKLPHLHYHKETEISTNYNNSTRVPIGTVAAYYKDYVEKQGLEKYFRCGTVVTSVKPIPGVANNSEEYGWLVQGYENETGRQFEYRCKRVVLATGTTDSTNRLKVSGEETYNWVTHDFKDFEEKLNRTNTLLKKSLQHFNDQYDTDDIKSGIEPVLIVGSGLSAADAIMAARLRGIPVIHVFRNHSNNNNNNNSSNNNNNYRHHHNNAKDKSDSRNNKRNRPDKLQWLPASMYPEYHEVYEMMADRGRKYPLYKALPDHMVVDFSVGADKYTCTKTRKVTLCSPQGRLISYRVSFAAILIGSKPDLSYLQNNGVGLGKTADKPIDSRSNQIDVDPFTYRADKASRKGLYAIGPLAGDNFVRFILGGAFGVLADIINTPE